MPSVVTTKLLFYVFKCSYFQMLLSITLDLNILTIIYKEMELFGINLNFHKCLSNIIIQSRKIFHLLFSFYFCFFFCQKGYPKLKIYLRL